MSKIIFETERLILREFTLADAHDLIPILSDPVIMKFSPMGPLIGEKLEENLKFTIAKYQETGAGFWAAVDKESQELVGRIGLPYWELDGEYFYEVAYRLKRSAWGKGYATEGAQGCVSHAFNVLKLDFVRSVIEPANLASVQVALRLGMHVEKTSVFHGKQVNVYRLDR